ncbi:unnamed protein product [Rotaria sp. Silwood1]|nr:unnamed protein product [Rotaria sp. Silwood1]
MWIPHAGIIPYCIRSVGLPSNLLVNNEKHVIHGTSITFETLQRENITSQQLYLLSAPIDVIERYQAFLENSQSSVSTQIFNNCSELWFGEYCQYSFNLTLSFYDIVRAYLFHMSLENDKLSKNETCYTFIECNRGPPPSCIDWREICDGKIDCLDDGRDEVDCEQLHMNECKEDEFRCSNGFCIPKEFFNDEPDYPDCIDRSDEQYSNNEYYFSGDTECHTDPTFSCEETKCRNERMLSCGDGQCTMDQCWNRREVTLSRVKLSRHENLHLSLDCWRSLICLKDPFSDLENLLHQVKCPDHNDNENIFRNSCLSFFFFPAQPILLSHVRFAYANNLSNEYENGVLLPHYICYDQELCEWLPATVLIDGATCRHVFELDIRISLANTETFEKRILNFFLKCSTTNITYINCPKSKPYRCANSSKCIALNRLVDGFFDCFQGDDEQIINSCQLPDIDYRFRCLSEHKCVPRIRVHTEIPICVGQEDRKFTRGSYQLNFHISFTTLCNGFVEHNRIDGSNYTDEMNCQDWPCNNAYTRCDGKWNCRNAVDEANCSDNPCRPDGHPCILPVSHNFTCLPLSRINDGHIDCVGGYDEQDRCGPISESTVARPYRCFNETQCIHFSSMCQLDAQTCSSGNDRNVWCEKVLHSSNKIHDNALVQRSLNSNETLYTNHLITGLENNLIVFFKINNHLPYPSMNTIISEHDSDATTTAYIFHFNQSNIEINTETNNYKLSANCNRGIPIYVNNLTKIYCLCPPAYFGYRCQNQSQRVSLTLQFQAVEWRTVFTFVIMLFDENTNIHSAEQIDYLSVRDCRKKFNLYLLYLKQPKDANQTYYIRIDIYNKEEKEYCVSIFYPIQYSFLPVHRLSLQVSVPIREVAIKSKKCPLKCLHGRCRHFWNSDKYFCQCSDGYSGILCTMKNSCDCSSDSICVEVVNNRSICVCPLDKFGPRCYLKRTLCNSNSCSDNGRCIVGEEKISETEHYCLCSQGYMGSRCEKSERKIEFLFVKTILLPQTIFIHFIDIPAEYSVPSGQAAPDPTQITMISKLKFHENSTFVYYGGRFHLIFVEFYQNYYLALLQHNSTLPMNISTTIIPEHRCLSINELLPDHIQKLSQWNRAKHYHIPCQNHTNLACFYDNDYFMCLCDIDRYANCFKFNYHPAHNCLGYNYCENDGQCYVDNRTCPTTSACLCKECYYGGRCQFTTTGFGLSLDDILSYNIWPNVPFTRQPTVVKISTGLTTIMFGIAIINAIASIITFQTKQSLQIGAGLYLLASSITSCITMTMFTLKFLLLLLSQMSIITNDSFLLLNCICTDLFLKSFSVVGEWLSACVNIERVLAVRLGVKFNKVRSRKVAKRVIFGIYLFTLISFIHDPFHRHLLPDVEEQRVWCVVRYSSSARKYASFVNIFHFLLPFCVNFIATVLIIILIAQAKSKIRLDETYRQHLWSQFHQHKHRLLSSFMLVVISIPRLIISLASPCMKSVSNSWLFLTGYFISFIPPLLIFILIVLPSKFYRKEFNEAIISIKTTIRHLVRHD